MKIAMVAAHADPLADITAPDFGAQNIHVAELSAGLTRAGHAVTVYTRRDCPDGARERVADAGYRVVRIDAGPAAQIPTDEVYDYLDVVTDGLAAAFAVDRPDVVHAHFWMSAITAVLAAFPERVPVVVTFHALGTVQRRFRGNTDTSPTQRIPLETVIGRRASAIIATCTDEVRELHDMGVSTRRVTIIPSGVAVDEFIASDPSDPRRPENITARSQAHRVVTVGRLVPHNGFATVIEAIADVPHTELLIVGSASNGALHDDPEVVRLMTCADEHAVGDRVHLIGAVPHATMPAVLADADIVVCAPWYEPFGIVALEAMAVGTPVVAAAVGGMLDTIVPGRTGDLVPPRDATALTQALRSLLDDHDRLQSYAEAGRRRAEQQYGWARIAAQTERLYRRLCEQRRTADSDVIGHASP